MAWKKKMNDGAGSVETDWRRRVAAHEAGHTALAWSSPYVTEVSSVTMEMKVIWPDQMLLSGLTAYAVSTASAGDPRHFWNQIVIALGGMAAEAFMLRSIRSLGCAVDLAGAKGYAELIVRRHGTAAIGWLPWDDEAAGPDVQQPDLAEMFSVPPDQTVRDILNACYRRARRGVAWRPDKLAAIMNALMNYDRLNNDDLRRLLGPRPLWC